MDAQDFRSLQEAYMEVVEKQQLDEISQKTATSTYAQRRAGEFEGDDSPDRVAKTNKLKGRIEKKFGAKAGEHADRAADVKTFGRKDASGRRKQSPQPRIQTSDYENQREFKRELRIKRDRRLRAARGEDTNEQVDLYDIILSHLLDEGYAETPEAAEAIMGNMSEEWRDDIVEADSIAAMRERAAKRRKQRYGDERFGRDDFKSNEQKKKEADARMQAYLDSKAKERG